MIEGLRQGLKDDGVSVSISKLCQWFNIPRRTVYYKPCTAPPRLNPAFVEPIKAMIEAVTCHCKVPPRPIRVRPLRGRTNEACTFH